MDPDYKAVYTVVLSNRFKTSISKVSALASIFWDRVVKILNVLAQLRKFMGK